MQIVSNTTGRLCRTKNYTKPTKVDGRFTCVDTGDKAIFAKLNDIVVCQACNKLFIAVAQYTTTAALDECRFIHASRQKSTVAYYDMDLVTVVQVASIKCASKRCFSANDVSFEGS